MPPRGPALTFDPRYVTAAIDAWRACNLEPIALSDLEREIARLMRERFIAWNIMGMREQTVSASSVTKAIGVFPALKLARRTTRGRGEARVTIITPTLGGRDVLAEEPIGGALYPRFAEYLSNASADITSLLNLLAQHGPLTQPVLHVLPEAPRRGAAYQAAIKEGLGDYRSQTTIINTPNIAYEPASPKPTPAQRVKAAQSWAMQAHPAGTLKQLDKAIAISLAFGLLWVDVAQVNEVIGIKSVGLAATYISKDPLINGSVFAKDLRERELYQIRHDLLAEGFPQGVRRWNWVWARKNMGNSLGMGKTALSGVCL